MDADAKERWMREQEMRVAAALTVASCSGATRSPSYVVKRYRAILRELRTTGGPESDMD